MGFLIMIIAFLAGLFLTIYGLANFKKNKSALFLTLIGILLILLAIYLAYPK